MNDKDIKKIGSAVGSAAVMAALLYAGNRVAKKRKARNEQKRDVPDSDLGETLREGPHETD